MIGAKSIKRDFRIFIFAAVVPALLIVIAFAYNAQAKKSVPYSTFNSKPYGTKALYLTIKRLGYGAERWQRPLGELPRKGTLIFIEPLVQLDDNIWDKLAGFMEKGGRVFWIAGGDVKIKEETLLRVRYLSEKNDTVRALVPTATGRALKDFTFRTTVRGKSDKESAVYHAGDKYGAVLLSVSYGRGEFVALVDPETVTNFSLKKNPENLRLITASLGAVNKKEPVYFNESSHYLIDSELPRGGLADLPLRVWAILPVWLKLISVQAAAVLVLWLYSDGKRLGPPKPAEAAIQETADYVVAMADLYRSAGARRMALATVYRNFISEITGAPGIGAEGETVAVMRAAKRTALDPETVKPPVERCRTLLAGDDELSEKELLNLVNHLYSLKKELKPYATHRYSRTL